MKSFIQNFDANGVTVKTHNKANDAPVGKPAGGNAVDQMAKRAAAKEIKS